MGHNFISTARIMWKHTDRGTALADSPESATGSRDEDYIILVKRPQKHQRMAATGGATQSIVELMPTTPR